MTLLSLRFQTTYTLLYSYGLLHEYKSFCGARVLHCCHKALSSLFYSPFVVEGAHNVFLETVKWGEDDSFKETVNLDDKSVMMTVILKLYEDYGEMHRPGFWFPCPQNNTSWRMKTRSSMFYVLRIHLVILAAPCGWVEVRTIKLVLGKCLAPSDKRSLSSLFSS